MYNPLITVPPKHHQSPHPKPSYYVSFLFFQFSKLSYSKYIFYSANIFEQPEERERVKGMIPKIVKNNQKFDKINQLIGSGSETILKSLKQQKPYF
ncbi:hypothetical protein B9Z55_024024 [Caenorhabditis nigoni]|uniref:Uncharacterized protein n=1 Tax=Caenorhabditis nigoni TaxID=1611254 RepID=A0A2G5SST2_9PELO|nr:hypothetical protein B9Z55_024024 [Caenorhabditis nigoni]